MGSARRAAGDQSKKPKKRVRRTAADARELILDAAEKRLTRVGPGGLRLQEIARDAGISHPTILHHFGSREALVEAVVMRALESSKRDVVRAFAAEQFEAPDAAALLRRVMEMLSGRGHARLLAWLALENRPQDDETQMIRVAAEAMHARRLAELGTKAPFEDTLFMVVLAALALLGEGILGEGVWNSAGLAADRHAPERFRAWLVDLLVTHGEAAASRAG
jgi:AcrR family transcriptional regulator